MQVSFPSLARLTARDRRILGPAMCAAGGAAKEEGRPALQALFATLAGALQAPKKGAAGVQIDALADLDDAVLERLIEGMSRQREREEGEGNPARAAFFDDARAALDAERTRRSEVLATMGAALDDRARRPPQGD